ncbi:hypothetical protein PM082_024777 [Marasmius tenuissimus]|nr:hypothetical protein PM082_024777 [Marasmius tenuissimus]
MSTLTFEKHIFGHAVGAWGHNKPLITIAVLIAETRKDVVFTILTMPTMYPKIMGELAKLSQERFKAIERQINVLQVIPPNPDPFYYAVEIETEFRKLFDQSGTITCLNSGKTIDCAYFPPPSVAIVDPFAEYAREGIRACASPEQVPIIAWMTGSAGPLLAMWGPEKYGGKGDVLSRLEEEMKRGKSELEAFESESVFGATDKVVQVPGYPPYYDYERFTQPVPEAMKTTNMNAVLHGLRFMAKTEGLITISSSVLEKEAVEACREHYASMGKSYFSIGPMPTIPAPSNGGKGDVQTLNQVISFLDSMKTEFGDKSVLYISFGTFFWPPDANVFRGIIDQIIASKTPFILAHPSLLLQPDQSLLEAVRACPTALDVTWAPQERILTHPATGWFLTHGGWNSTQEALLYKVPLIMWPMAGDQPLNALLLSTKFDAAFELIEVRSGKDGQQKPYRYREQPTPRFTIESAKEEFEHILSDMQGEKGQHVRKTLEDLSGQIEGVWGANGEARRELEAFLYRYVD